MPFRNPDPLPTGAAASPVATPGQADGRIKGAATDPGATSGRGTS